MVTHHVLPVQHLQDVAEQLAAGLQVLLPLQVVLELIRHHGEQDFSAVYMGKRVAVSARATKVNSRLPEVSPPLSAFGIHILQQGN